MDAGLTDRPIPVTWKETGGGGEGVGVGCTFGVGAVGVACEVGVFEEEVVEVACDV